jgi:hypothetical protein
MVETDPYAQQLADGIDAFLPTWVVRSVTTLMMAWSGTVPPEVLLAAEQAAVEAGQEVGGAVRSLLETDIDEQRSTPLTLLRGAVRYPTEVLRAAGVPPVERDRFAEEAFPSDLYDLSPASFADIDPALADVGLAWSASKAMQHRRRHRS